MIEYCYIHLLSFKNDGCVLVWEDFLCALGSVFLSSENVFEFGKENSDAERDTWM